jgi:hypothetical protein
MNQYKGPAYLAMRATRDKGRTYQWHVFPMPLSRGDVTPDGGIRAGSAASFRGPFAEQRARRRARKLNRRPR